MLVSEAVEEYAIELNVRGYAPRTVLNMRNKLRAFSVFCNEWCDASELRDLSPATVKEYSRSLLDRGCKGSYVNLALKNIKGFLSWCKDEYGEGFDARKDGRVQLVKEEVPHIAMLSPADVKFIMSNCKGASFVDLRDAALLTMLFETGMRIGEVFDLKPECVFEDYIVIEHSKNGRSRVVPITPVLKRAMLRYERICPKYFRYRHREDWYFLSVKGRKLTYGTAKYIMKKRSKGLETDARISPHSCRHFYAQQQLRNGAMDIWTLSRILGHAKIATTTVYLQQMRDEDVVKMAKEKSVLLNL